MPVPIPMAVAIFFTLWWTVLFAVLPFGVQSQEESGTVAPGTERGAPTTPRLVSKALWTTLVSFIIFAGLMLFISWTGSN